MAQEDKRLLIQDLSARIPYGVKVQEEKYKGVFVVDSFGKDPYGEYVVNRYVHIERLKPYLRPMSSMTDKEVEELYSMPEIRYENHTEMGSVANYQQIDWLLAHHFDFRRLIAKGLALPAPEGMYKSE